MGDDKRMNKRGGIVLRDLFFIMILTTGIMLFAGIFVQEMGDSYDDSTIYGEYSSSGAYANSSARFNETAGNLESMGESLSDGGILTFVTGGLDAAGDVLMFVLSMPSNFASLIVSPLRSMEVDSSLTNTVNYLIVGLLWALIIFAIVTAFLKGGRM